MQGARRLRPQAWLLAAMSFWAKRWDDRDNRCVNVSTMATAAMENVLDGQLTYYN